ncbi:MAG: ABC transporter permease [Balneolaceae bacterium]|nr:ABC transporter permease [Balneolaceae bacterium]
MLKNYLKIAYRNLVKQKGYSLINILGLAVGLASCIIILLYVIHELSYDKHHEKSDRIYRVIAKIDFSGNYLELATVPAPMGPTLKQDFPEVEAVTRFRPRGGYLFRLDNDNIKENRVVWASNSVFDVFTIPMIHGNPDEALKDPMTAVISRSSALKYFGHTDVVGESILMEDRHTLTVTGVYRDMPETSHFHFDFLLSLETLDEADNTTWFSNNFRTYIVLKEGVDARRFERHFETIKKEYVEPQLQQFMGSTLKEFEAAGNSLEYDLQPLTDIHLYSDLTGEFEPNGSIIHVYAFSGLALFILLLACINFMNLATARSSQRAREVGIRKTLGSMRGQLSLQFLAESVIFSALAFALALLLVEFSLPYFSDLAQRDISQNYFSNPLLLLAIGGIVLITGLLAGSYPAFLLSSFKPAKVLKGTFVEARGQDYLRKGLVVFQFSISIVIIVGLLGMNRQLNYIQNRELGFEKDRVLVLHDVNALGEQQKVETFKKELLKDPVFISAAPTSFLPVGGFGKNDLTFWPKGERPTQDNTVALQTWDVDEHYIPTLGMDVIEGRNFSEELASDRQAAILNESAVKRFGFEEPIGQKIQTVSVKPDGSIDTENQREFTIIGVVKNFHYESLRQTISPLGLFYGPSYGTLAIKIKSGNATLAIDQLEEAWNRFAPSQPFNYSFLDQRFEQMYRGEMRVKNLMTAFSILAMIIACLGLFGLSAYSAERRTREIGIRKVMGATVSNILTLMSTEFIKLIVLSYIISLPLSYIVLRWWLQDFAYKTELGFGIFVITGAAVLLVALATVSWQSVRAARMDPVESLRKD